MVFSSLPLYLDPPNWQHQQQPQGFGNNEIDQQQQQPQPQPLPAPPQQQLLQPQPAGSGGRQASTAERARLAKIPQPETPLKCPRCESTNTKFCYFNNYSLSQPRHFCKTCRRYWTRGGALRNVPVGGGCRRNNGTKRTKNPRPKSPAGAAAAATTTRVGTADSSASFGGGGSHFLQPTTSYLATLQNLTRFGMGNLGLNLERTININDMESHMSDGIHFQATAAGSYDDHNGSGQEMPFLGTSGTGGGFEGMLPSVSASMNAYHHHHHFNNMNGGSAVPSSYDHNDMMMRSTTVRGNSSDGHDQTMVLAQFGGVKTEAENQVGSIISKQFMEMPLPGHNHDQIWGGAPGTNNGNMWMTDLSGITPSSTSATAATHML